MKIACSKCFKIHERTKNGKCPNVSNTNIYVKKHTQRYYNSYQWTKTREEIIDRQNGLCIISRALFDKDSKHKLNPIEEVHHIKKLEDCIRDREEHLIYDTSNLIGITKEFHRAIHKHKLDSIDKIEKHFKINLKKYL